MFPLTELQSWVVLSVLIIANLIAWGIPTYAIVTKLRNR